MCLLGTPEPVLLTAASCATGSTIFAGAENLVQSTGKGCLHVGDDVPIDVQGRDRAGMTKAFANQVDRYPFGQQQYRMGSVSADRREECPPGPRFPEKSAASDSTNRTHPWASQPIPIGEKVRIRLVAPRKSRTELRQNIRLVSRSDQFRPKPR